MSKRAYKLTAMIMSGAVLLQLGGCATILLQNFAGYFISSFLSTVISGIVGALTGGTTPA